MHAHSTIHLSSYECPHPAMYLACSYYYLYVSSYCCICVLILLHMCPHTTVSVSSYCCICVLMLLYMCPHTAMYLVSSYYCMCPHTTASVSSYCYICVLMLLYLCPHTAASVSSYYLFVLILLHLCPHTCWWRRTLFSRVADFTTALLLLYYCFTNLLVEEDAILGIRVGAA